MRLGRRLEVVGLVRWASMPFASAALMAVVLMSLASTEASGVPPCVRMNFVAMTPGRSADPETTAATLSRMRCLASAGRSSGSSRSREATMYAASRPVRSPAPEDLSPCIFTLPIKSRLAMVLHAARIWQIAIRAAAVRVRSWLSAALWYKGRGSTQPHSPDAVPPPLEYALPHRHRSLWQLDRVDDSAITPDGSAAVCAVTTYCDAGEQGRHGLWLLPTA